MCGICGIVNVSASDHVDSGLLRRMTDSLRHRGPDDEGAFTCRNFGIAMRRLSVIDLTTGQQPIFNEDRTVAVVFNGEIYNYRQLRVELEQKGHVFRSQADTEVIVHLYESYGLDFPLRLRGMFGIALLDMRQDRLVLVRDRLGIKPLYYARNGNSLLFASEIKALLISPDVSRRIDCRALDDYFSFLYTPAPKTIYEDIRALLPGSMLVCTGGSCSMTRYWDLAAVYEQSAGLRASPRSEGDVAAELYGLLKEAVREELVSDVPLGAFLSGGIDSSTIVILMQELLGKNVKTFSLGFGDSPYTELAYAREIARVYGTEHYELEVQPDMIDLLPKLVGYLDEPFADSSIVPTYLVSQMARRSVTVALSGDGGDESFAGYAWTKVNHLLEPYRLCPAGIRRALARACGMMPFASVTGRKIARLSECMAADYREGFAKRITCYEDEMKKELYTAEFARAVRGYDPAEQLYRRFTEVPAADHSSAMLYADAVMYLPDDNLKKVDRMSMAHSLEVRVPYLDHRIVEYAAGIPFGMKIKGHITKYIVKKAFAGRFPPKVLAQRKHGFAMPVHEWFRGQLQGYARDILGDDHSRIFSYVRQECVSEVLRRHLAGRENLGNHIFSLIMLELWLRNQDTPV
jgi:asparagine synthase (glutamine-hydrolysing)